MNILLRGLAWFIKEANQARSESGKFNLSKRTLKCIRGKSPHFAIERSEQF